MNSHTRLTRLRALVRQLEENGPSPERDALLREMRERMTLLEIGAQESSGWSRRDRDAAELADPGAAVVLLS
jgi:hypothetical protein